ncbi:MAG: hypothetical protein WDO69_35010 [Pseudomonadota bacterium]
MRRASTQSCAAQARSPAHSTGGTPRVAFDFTVKGGLITRIEVVADPARLSGMDLELVPAG